MNIKLTKPRFSFLQVLLINLSVIALLAFFARQQIENARQVEALPIIERSGVALSEPLYKEDYQFTQDWFSEHAPVWSELLEPYVGKEDIQYLEIGVFEGSATMWVIENVLLKPSSQLTGIDLFAGDYEGAYPDFAKRFFENLALSGIGERATILTGYSQEKLRALPLNYYDIIYIDGSHRNDDVLEDAVLSWRLLKTGGMLIFDDYGRRQLDLTDPKYGIDAFYRFYGHHFEVLHNDHQIFMKKTS